MAAKKKTITNSKKTSGVSTKKATVKKTVVKSEATKATNKKIVRSRRSLKTEEGADSIASGVKLGESVDEGKSSSNSRTSYEKLMNPQNYHEYMRASKFRGRH